MLYIALTRTTKYLTVLHAGAPLPKVYTHPTVGDADTYSNADREAGVPVRDQQRLSEVEDGRRPDRLVRVVARDLADQIGDSVGEESWDALVEALIDELASQRKES